MATAATVGGKITASMYNELVGAVTSYATFIVYGGTAQSIVSGTWTLLSTFWGSPTISRDFTSFTSGVLTVGRSGTYEVGGSIAFSTGATTRGFQITKNSTAVDTSATIVNTQSQGVSAAGSGLVSLSTGDVLRLYAIQVTGSSASPSLTGNSGQFFARWVSA